MSYVKKVCRGQTTLLPQSDKWYSAECGAEV